MFGHVEAPLHWARHLLVLRDLQAETAGFTEFVPLPFVHMEAPMYLRGLARRGPSFREALLMHSVARLVLHPEDALARGLSDGGMAKLGDGHGNAVLPVAISARVAKGAAWIENSYEATAPIAPAARLAVVGA